MATSSSKAFPASRRRALVVGIALLALAYRTFASRLRVWRARMDGARERRAKSEAAEFRRFREVARSDDPRATANALSSWLAHAPELSADATFQGLAAGASDPELAAELQRLDEILFGAGVGGSPLAWSGEKLVTRLAAARRRLNTQPARRRARIATAPLEPLNP